MTLQLNQIGRTFVAEASGIDLAAGIDASTAHDIDVALSRHGVLVFRDQRLNDDQQQAFIQQFGPPVVTKLKEIAGSHPHFYDIGTVDAEGNPIPDDSVKGQYLLANLQWHTDGSQNQPPIRLTALHARVLPPVPPPTEYADMHAAWADLPEDTKREIDGLMVEHSIVYSRVKMGMKVEDFSDETLQERKPVRHPLVRIHFLSGRKSLYLASHASHIIGWPVEKGRALVDALTEHATQAKYVYSHQWRPHDLVMWDDAWTMHRATPYKDKHPRQMRWCGVRELEAV